MENDVNLDYGLQLINNHNMAEEDEEDEESAIENFVDSPRQMDRQNSQNSARSGNSTPLVTVPDMDHSNLISNNWPLQLGSYNREKKHIRDVSNMQLNRHLSN